MDGWMDELERGVKQILDSTDTPREQERGPPMQPTYPLLATAVSQRVSQRVSQ